MHIPKWCNRLKKCLPHSGKKRSTKDTVCVKLLGLEIQVSREISSDLPHEVTVVIPRVEYRLTQQPQETLINGEVLLNSITIAHSPRWERTESSKPKLVQSPNDQR